jgi:hypothetical protein
MRSWKQKSSAESQRVRVLGIGIGTLAMGGLVAALARLIAGPARPQAASDSEDLSMGDVPHLPAGLGR